MKFVSWIPFTTEVKTQTGLFFIFLLGLSLDAHESKWRGTGGGAWPTQLVNEYTFFSSLCNSVFSLGRIQLCAIG